MANDISKIKIGSTTYNIKDTTARNSISNNVVLKHNANGSLYNRLYNTTTGIKNKNTVTLTGNALLYRFFGIITGTNTSAGDIEKIMLLGTWGEWNPPATWTSGTIIHSSGSFDTGSTTYTKVCSLQATSTSNKFSINCSVHAIDNHTVNDDSYLFQVWGLF